MGIIQETEAYQISRSWTVDSNNVLLPSVIQWFRTFVLGQFRSSFKTVSDQLTTSFPPKIETTSIHIFFAINRVPALGAILQTSTSAGMGTNCRIQLLLSESHDEESQTIIASMHEILIDAFDLIDDNIIVALERPQMDHRLQSVSLIYNGVWACQIYLNENEASVHSDCEKWCVLHGNDLSLEERTHILTCKHRLDVFCDSDAGHLFNDEFHDLIMYLRLIFDSSYVFDPLQKRFILE